MPVAGEAGQELQLDTGWVGWLMLIKHKRRFRAWIFTAVRSRHRLVYRRPPEKQALIWGAGSKAVAPSEIKARGDIDVGAP